MEKRIRFVRASEPWRAAECSGRIKRICLPSLFPLLDSGLRTRLKPVAKQETPLNPTTKYGFTKKEGEKMMLKYWEDAVLMLEA